MGIFRNKLRIEISPSVCLLGARSLLVLPLKWVMAAVAAAVWHEFCHILAVWLCRGQVWNLQIGASGAVIDVLPMSRGWDLICALAGPVGGLALLFVFRWMPRIAVCAAFQSAYNLLPIYPLDGGRALRCGAAILLPPPVADGVGLWVERAVKALILCVGIYGCFWLRLGLLPLIIGILLAARPNSEKVLAKKAARGYNSLTIAKRYDYDGFTKQNPSHCAKACPIHRWGVQRNKERSC